MSEYLKSLGQEKPPKTPEKLARQIHKVVSDLGVRALGMQEAIKAGNATVKEGVTEDNLTARTILKPDDYSFEHIKRRIDDQGQQTAVISRVSPYAPGEVHFSKTVGNSNGSKRISLVATSDEVQGSFERNVPNPDPTSIFSQVTEARTDLTTDQIAQAAGRQLGDLRNELVARSIAYKENPAIKQAVDEAIMSQGINDVINS